MRSVYLISGAFKLLNKNKAYHFVEINTASILKLNSGLKTQNSIPKNIFWNEISSNLNINDVFFIPGGNPLDIINEKNTFVTEKVIFDNNNESKSFNYLIKKMIEPHHIKRFSILEVIKYAS